MMSDNKDGELTDDQVAAILCPVEREAVGAKGQHIESCLPLQLPAQLDAQFIKQVITRCLCSSYREPHIFSSFVVNSSVLVKILRKTILVLSQEENVIDVVVPDTGCTHVVGDTHGDLHSLISVLGRTGLPSEHNRIVFSGDYVDRGPWGVEILLILSLLKLWQPTNFFMLRGNHETTGCIQRYGFEEEVKYKLCTKMLPLYVNLFRQLPLVTVVRTIPHDIENANANAKKNSQSAKQHTKKHATRSTRKQSAIATSSSSSSQYSWNGPLIRGEKRCVVLHGGLFRSDEARKEKRNDLARLTELVTLNRNVGDPYGNAVEDVLWSDPQLEFNGIAENNLRGCGILFGPTTAEYFFQHNSVHGMIRAHEGPDMRSDRRPDMPHMQNGFSVDMEVASGFVATVFSSANYSFQEPKGNKGAFATIFGKRHRDGPTTAVLPRFTMFERFDPPPDDQVHLFYMSEGPSVTPRQSFS